MKKQFISICLVLLMLLSLTACGNPDGKKLIEDAINNPDEITYSDISLHLSIEEVAETKVSMGIDLQAKESADAAILDMGMKVMGISMKDTLYIDPATLNMYFKGIDGVWYKTETSTNDSLVIRNQQLSAGGQSFAAIVPLCSQINTVGKENLDGRSVYKVQMVLDGGKLLEYSLAISGTPLDDLNLSDKELEQMKQQMQSLMDAFEIYLYIEAATPRFAGVYMTINKTAIKKFITSMGADAEDLKEAASVIDGIEFEMNGSYHYDESPLSLPEEAKGATLLTDEDEIAQKMPLLSILNQFGQLIPDLQ